MSMTLTDKEIAGRKAPRGTLESLSVEALLEMRARITELLPAAALKDMDLEQELVIQFQTLKTLQAEVLSDSEVPANQRAQVANSVGSTLQNLSKMQVEQYSSERFKQIEMILINLLNTWPAPMTAKFFAEYEALSI